MPFLNRGLGQAGEKRCRHLQALGVSQGETGGGLQIPRAAGWSRSQSWSRYCSEALSRCIDLCPKAAPALDCGWTGCAFRTVRSGAVSGLGRDGGGSSAGGTGGCGQGWAGVGRARPRRGCAECCLPGESPAGTPHPSPATASVPGAEPGLRPSDPFPRRGIAWASRQDNAVD